MAGVANRTLAAQPAATAATATAATVTALLVALVAVLLVALAATRDGVILIIQIGIHIVTEAVDELEEWLVHSATGGRKNKWVGAHPWF
jgi:hypothetical protein